MSKKPKPRHPVQKSYPSPEQRERIIRQRYKLAQELLKLAVGEKFDPRQIDRLTRRYDLEQVLFVMNAVGNRFFGRSEMIGDSTRAYRQYRLTFARFGGDRPFLKRPEYAALCSDQVELHARRRPKFFRRRGPDPRGREIDDLLLSGADYWADITPPAVPPRPDDYDAPPAGNYGYPTRTLLKWGLAVDGERITNNARNTNKWLPAIPALSQMALDDGLLDGWPGEPASWAPHHAIHMLGQLQAHQEAGRLLTLLERENDWLSDLLAAVWARMGPQAEPPLWDYLAEGRGMPENGLNETLMDKVIDHSLHASSF